MNAVESNVLDMASLLLRAYDLGDAILQSREANDYLRWKREMEQSEEARRLIREMQKRKEKFAECERFGHFHPEYHKALEAVKETERELEQIEAVARFKEAENRLDELLHEVSLIIARSVSDSIKVPSNNPLPVSGCGGCGTGGSCSCG
jgi:cell fate (sporulation/competence/biofilm development) regulator YlbF (YheA/YmcA/DUF963 family)